MNLFEQLAESIEAGEAGIKHLLVQRDTETTAAVTGLEGTVDHIEQVAVMTAKTALNAQAISLEMVENTGQHDDLGMHPERREAEIDDLNRSFNAPFAPGGDSRISGSESLVRQETVAPAQSDELAAKKLSVAESLRTVYAIHEQTESSNEQR